ncbi:HAMP domain-containing histidine kinase [Pirellulaceae bacterium]|nr:HAMP domain-containing histidine kinase [Pirellulaceae bacterium]
MKIKTIILLLFVVILPTTLLSWGGYQLAQKQSEQIETQVRELLADQLTEIDSRIKKYFSIQEALLEKATSRPFPTLDSIRETVNSTGIIDNIFIINPNDSLAFPNLISPLNQRERDFHEKIKTIVEDGDIRNQVLQTLGIKRNRVGALQNLNAIPQDQTDATNNLNSNWVPKTGAGQDFQSGQQSLRRSIQENLIQQDTQQETARDQESGGQLPQQLNRRFFNVLSDPEKQTNRSDVLETCSGWFVWYWGRGLNLIYWQRLASGRIVCVALERSRWMSDLVNELPESIANPTDRELLSNKKDVRTTRIVNSNGATVYQWGDNPTDDLVLAADITVSQPLNSWRLQMAVDPSIFKSQTTVGANIVLGIVASSIALIAVAWIFIREYNKELTEAGRRVSFVNQVSHELRTPLTNIRMYAELLGLDLQRVNGIDSEKAQKRLSVVESESERLSRLIGNVLTFAGNQKHKLKLHETTGVVDDCIESVLSSFAPNLEKINLEIKTDFSASKEVRFDSDVLEQIVGNLISNVEKYASDGEHVCVSTRYDNGVSEIVVQDDGFGVKPADRNKIFEPFWRVSNDLKHASGTGIGLSISRELARLHGGDLRLNPTEIGACFVVTLRTTEI